MKKGVLENFAKFTGKHLWFAKFSKTPFYRTPLDDCFWLFRATLLKWGTANNVWKNSDEYSLPRNTNLRSTVQVYHFLLGSINFQCMLSLSLHCLLPEAAIRAEVFCKKGVLNPFMTEAVIIQKLVTIFFFCVFSGQVDSLESPETPEITKVTENFTKVTKYLTKLKDTLILC